MSGWDEWSRFRRTPKKPAPEHGIKIKKAGSTWWGQRWLEALEHVLGGDSSRLARGRTYARAGRTHDLVVDGGQITANVTGSRATPYRISIQLKQLTAEQWQQAIAAMAEQAQFSAELLAGQMPQAVDEAFNAAGASLFPRERAELVTSCSCPDWGDPCKHVAATHYVLGEALDRDPFLLFELRGRGKAQVLDALRSARSQRALSGETDSDVTASTQPGPGREHQDDDSAAVPKVALGELKPSEYEAPRAALPALQFSFDAPVSHGALLRQLGAPAAWRDERPPAEWLDPVVRAAAEIARRLALAETPTDTDDASAALPAPSRSSRRTRAARSPDGSMTTHHETTTMTKATTPKPAKPAHTPPPASRERATSGRRAISAAATVKPKPTGRAKPPVTAADVDPRWAPLVKAFASDPTVISGKMMASQGLKVNGKIFAMLVRGHLVVKLPKARVDELVGSGVGEHFDPRQDGRLMKEWFVLNGKTPSWLTLAKEAHRYVGGGR